MSRFADDDDVVTIALGPCQCPETPHARDEAVVHRQLGYGAKGDITTAGWLAGKGIVFDGMAARRKFIELGVVSWNLLGPDARPVTPSALSIARLDEETIDTLADAMDGALNREPLPNVSGAPSAASSPASASPNRETRRRRSSTTS
jgi:hypothetical protein